LSRKSDEVKGEHDFLKKDKLSLMVCSYLLYGLVIYCEGSEKLYVVQNCLFNTYPYWVIHFIDNGTTKNA